MFLQTMEQRQCSAEGSADFVATVNTLVQKRSVSGYLETLPPDFLKIVALAPFGQPIMIFTTDGATIRYGDIPGGKYYSGKSGDTVLADYGLRGMTAEGLSAWFVAGLNTTDIIGEVVGRSVSGNGYWIAIQTGDNFLRSQVNFDPLLRRITERVVLDEKGGIAWSVRYEYPNFTIHGDTGCFPSRIDIKSNRTGGGEVAIDLAWQKDVHLTPEQFNIKFPDTFERIELH